MKDHRHHHLTLEMTVISAHSLKNRSSFLFSQRLRPYVTLSADHHYQQQQKEQQLPPPPNGDSTTTVLYRTRVEEKGDANPTWGDTIHFPLDPSFLRNQDSAAVDLYVLSDRPLRSPARLGWCRIPASDLMEGFRPLGTARRLSYALRDCRHGGRGHGVIDVAVRLVGPAVGVVERALPPTPEVLVLPPCVGWGEVAIGIPVGAAFGVPNSSAAERKARGQASGWEYSLTKERAFRNSM